jgi:acetylornithine deacetylase/succinyl-diaminopimelate desuccinylase-like protein
METSEKVIYPELMQIFSRPRPSGSAAERETVAAVQNWLTMRGLPCRLQPFTLYPYFFICIGLWMVITNTLLVLSIWLRWGDLTGIFAILSVAGGLADTAFDIPLITWPGKTTGQNILVEFEPPDPKRELVISAHYDSKTELFDHQIRTFFVRNLRFGIVLAILSGILSNWGEIGHWVSVVLTVPLLLLAWGLGLNLSLGRLRRNPSQGAVDNGAACAILLGLAQKVVDGDVPLENTRLTLALFGGEEVNMQGSRAYTLGRDWKLPSAALNLEIMAQDGDYVTWEQDGMAFQLFPTDEALSRSIAEAVTNVTGKPAIPAGPINSDGYSFIRAKIPLAVLGTYDSKIDACGLHLPSDNLSRVKIPRLAEGVEILANFIQLLDREPVILLDTGC